MIPATFMPGPGHEVTSLERAKSLVSSNPRRLLREDSFDSKVDRVAAPEYGIRPTDVVADIGCGSGALVFKLLREQVRFSRIYAVDVNRDSLEFVRFALAALGHESGSRVETVLSTLDDVSLPAGSVDVMIVFNTPIGAAPPRATSRAPLTRDLSFIRSLAHALRPAGVVHYVLVGSQSDMVTVRPAFESAGFRTTSESLFMGGEGGTGTHLVFVAPPGGREPLPDGRGTPEGARLNI